MPVLLSGFRSLRPAHRSPQGRALRWIAGAHARSSGRPEEETRKLLARYGCGPDRIAARGHELPDFLHADWSRMDIYRLAEDRRGLGMEARTAWFARAVDRVFDALFPRRAAPPSHLLHVTCTGYSSPSGAQKLVSRRGWGARTCVLHAYHMGCYASIPALRIARGLLSAEGRRVDVVHTEICSLHLNPERVEPEQLVIESLFADGFIRYGVGGEGKGGFELLALREELLPGSEELMRWSCADDGMRMALSKEVPGRIAPALPAFAARLAKAAGAGRAEVRRAAFAVHPGGPRILDAARAALSLSDEQISASRRVLKERGNMSSATLPHIWAEMDKDPDIKEGRLILSLAFGPGLTLCGAALRKR